MINNKTIYYQKAFFMTQQIYLINLEEKNFYWPVKLTNVIPNLSDIKLSSLEFQAYNLFYYGSTINKIFEKKLNSLLNGNLKLFKLNNYQFIQLEFLKVKYGSKFNQFIKAMEEATIDYQSQTTDRKLFKSLYIQKIIKKNLHKNQKQYENKKRQKQNIKLFERQLKSLAKKLSKDMSAHKQKMPKHNQHLGSIKQKSFIDNQQTQQFSQKHSPFSINSAIFNSQSIQSRKYKRMKPFQLIQDSIKADFHPKKKRKKVLQINKKLKKQTSPLNGRVLTKKESSESLKTQLECSLNFKNPKQSKSNNQLSRASAICKFGNDKIADDEIKSDSKSIFSSINQQKLSFSYNLRSHSKNGRSSFVKIDLNTVKKIKLKKIPSIPQIKKYQTNKVPILNSQKYLSFNHPSKIQEIQIYFKILRILFETNNNSNVSIKYFGHSLLIQQLYISFLQKRQATQLKWEVTNLKRQIFQEEYQSNLNIFDQNETKVKRICEKYNAVHINSIHELSKAMNNHFQLKNNLPHKKQSYKIKNQLQLCFLLNTNSSNSLKKLKISDTSHQKLSFKTKGTSKTTNSFNKQASIHNLNNKKKNQQIPQNQHSILIWPFSTSVFCFLFLCLDRFQASIQFFGTAIRDLVKQSKIIKEIKPLSKKISNQTLNFTHSSKILSSFFKNKAEASKSKRQKKICQKLSKKYNCSHPYCRNVKCNDFQLLKSITQILLIAQKQDWNQNRINWDLIIHEIQSIFQKINAQYSQIINQTADTKLPSNFNLLLRNLSQNRYFKSTKLQNSQCITHKKFLLIYQLSQLIQSRCSHEQYRKSQEKIQQNCKEKHQFDKTQELTLKSQKNQSSEINLSNHFKMPIRIRSSINNQNSFLKYLGKEDSNQVVTDFFEERLNSKFLNRMNCQPTKLISKGFFQTSFRILPSQSKQFRERKVPMNQF